MATWHHGKCGAFTRSSSVAPHRGVVGSERTRVCKRQESPSSGCSERTHVNLSTEAAQKYFTNMFTH